MDLHCNSIEFVGQKHCFLFATSVCLKSTYVATRFQPLFYYIETRCIFLIRTSSLFNQKEGMSFLPIYIYEKKKVFFRRECARSCVRGALPFRLLHNAQSRNRRRVSRLFRDVLCSFLSTLDNQERRYRHVRAHRLPR